MNHTANYQLSQWAKSDQVKMEDFNADNAKIDAALKTEADTRSTQMAGLTAAVTLRGNCQIYPFTYTGTGGAQTLTFPRKPLLVVVADVAGAVAVCVYGAHARSVGNTGGTTIMMTWEGNSVSWNDSQINYKDRVYSGLAFFSME